MAGRMFEMLAQQLLSASAKEIDAQNQRNAARFNPNPPGGIWPGSSTDAVLALLRDSPAAWFSRCQIIVATGRPNRNINHALNFLVATGQVVTAPDGARNPRYLRYRIARQA